MNKIILAKEGAEIVSASEGSELKRAERLIKRRDYEKAKSILMKLAHSSDKEISAKAKFKLGFIMMQLGTISAQEEKIIREQGYIDIQHNYARRREPVAFDYWGTPIQSIEYSVLRSISHIVDFDFTDRIEAKKKMMRGAAELFSMLRFFMPTALGYLRATFNGAFAYEAGWDYESAIGMYRDIVAQNQGTYQKVEKGDRKKMKEVTLWSEENLLHLLMFLYDYNAVKIEADSLVKSLKVAGKEINPHTLKKATAEDRQKIENNRQYAPSFRERLKRGVEREANRDWISFERGFGDLPPIQEIVDRHSGRTL